MNTMRKFIRHSESLTESHTVKQTAALLIAILMIFASACAGSGKIAPTDLSVGSSGSEKGLPSNITMDSEKPEDTTGSDWAGSSTKPEDSMSASSPSDETTSGQPAMPDMEVTSEGIVDGFIGDAFGAKGEQFVSGKVPSRSFPLAVSHIPDGTAALALTVIDPDGGNWVHWLAVNIPVSGSACEIPENASLDWPEAIIQGRNDFKTPGYGGPTPPSGVHTYVVTVYALSGTLDLEQGFNLKGLTKAMQGKVLAEAVIMGKYAR